MQSEAPLLAVKETAASCPSLEPHEFSPRPPLRHISMLSSVFQFFTFLQFFPTDKLRAVYSFVDPSGNPCPLIPNTSFRMPLLCNRALLNDTHQMSHAHKQLVKFVFFGASCGWGRGGGPLDLGAGLLVQTLPTGTVNETSRCWSPVETDCPLLSLEAEALRFLQLTGWGRETQFRAFRSAEIAKVSALSVTSVFVPFRLCG